MLAVSFTMYPFLFIYFICFAWIFSRSGFRYLRCFSYLLVSVLNSSSTFFLWIMYNIFTSYFKLKRYFSKMEKSTRRSVECIEFILVFLCCCPARNISGLKLVLDCCALNMKTKLIDWLSRGSGKSAVKRHRHA